MLVKTLIDKAQEECLCTLGQLARMMEVPQSRLSEWKNGKCSPSPAQTAYMASLAGVNPILAIAEIEAEKKPDTIDLWQAAGVKIGGNGGIRTLDGAINPILP